jgi:hypothetical protein
VPLNHAHTYQVSYYGPAELIKEPEDRGYPKHRRVRAVSANRAINAVMTSLLNERKEVGGSASKREFLILEAKVVA